MTDNSVQAFEQQARENLTMTEKRMATFMKQAAALRRNLKLRQKQQKERQKKCMPSK